MMSKRNLFFVLYKNQRSDSWLAVINPDLFVGVATSVCVGVVVWGGGGGEIFKKISKFLKNLILI